MQKNNVFDEYYFCRTFILITSYQILRNDAIQINHELFFQETESSQLYRSQFLEINLKKKKKKIYLYLKIFKFEQKKMLR